MQFEYTYVTVELSTAPDRSLLRLLVWEPIQSFEVKTIQVAIGCWEWLLVARPELEYSVSNLIEHADTQLYKCVCIYIIHYLAHKIHLCIHIMVSTFPYSV